MGVLPHFGDDVRPIFQVGLAHEIDPVSHRYAVFGLARLVEQKDRATDLQLISVVQLLDPHGDAVDQRSVGAIAVAHRELPVAELNRGMLPRGFRIADTDVIPAAASQRDGFWPDLKADALIGSADDQEGGFR